jgi:hypothetical protein
MSDAVCDGVTRTETLKHDTAVLHQKLAGAAKAYQWDRMLAILTRQPISSIPRGRVGNHFTRR